MEEDKIIGLTYEQFVSRKEMCKELVTKADMLLRLEKNPDFKELILKEYIEDEAARLVALLAEQSFNMSTPGKEGTGLTKAFYREDIMERMHGIARLNEYLSNVIKMGNHARNELEGLAEAESNYHSGSVQ